jgi:hypothetical protein
MRKYKAAHPLFKHDMSVVFAPGMHKIRSDVKGIVATRTKQPVASKKCVLNIPWLSHQNIPCATPGYCGYESCPGKSSGAKRKRSHKTYMICKQCTNAAADEINVHFCNTVTNKGPVLCHELHHKECNEKRLKLMRASGH